MICFGSYTTILAFNLLVDLRQACPGKHSPPQRMHDPGPEVCASEQLCFLRPSPKMHNALFAVGAGVYEEPQLTSAAS
jgi:hypothetical protein